MTLTGCATPTKMALLDEKTSDIGTKKPVYLMTVTLRNSFHTSYQPRLLVVHTEKPDAKEKSDRINFTMDDLAKYDEDDSKEKGNTYLIRMEFDPGKYEIVGFTSRVKSFLTPGWFFTPLHADIEVNSPGVFYLGHVSGIVRKRNEGEFRAGPPIPILDQAVVGAADGTFDVEITDDFNKDEAIFRETFPSLAGITIQKAILPPFDRAKAQQWWEAH